MTRTNPGLWTEGFGEVGAFLKALQDNGVTKEHVARIRSDKHYAKRVAEFMLRDGYEASVHQKLARAILGNHFFGVEDWSALYGVRFTKKQLREADEFPWDDEVLQSTCPLCQKTVKDCHFAFLGLEKVNGTPLTVAQWQQLHPATGQPRFYSYGSDSWYRNEKFATEVTCQFRWHLLHQEIVPNSTDETFEAQQVMLPDEYEVPLVIAEVAKDILHFRKTGKYLNPNRYARCQDFTSDGSRVYVGRSGSDGLRVVRWGDGAGSSIGVGASRKLPE